MRTLGVDLGAQDKKTAMCTITWAPGGAVVEPPVMSSGEDTIIDAMRSADWIGIDAPFGWPDAMVEAIHGYAHGEPWPTAAAPPTLRYRATDWFVHDTIAAERGIPVWPL